MIAPVEKGDDGAARMSELGKIFVVFGLLMVILGVVLMAAGTFSGKVPWLGRLPGDIYIKRDNWTLYFPLATSIIISIILTVIFSLFRR